MDESHGKCQLSEPEIGKIMSSAFLHFDTKRYVMHSFVVMPNHVHLLFSISEDENLSDVIHSWKSFTATKINRFFNSEGKRLWQKDYFDRIIRDHRHFSTCAKYIRNNPEKANLKRREFLLYESTYVSQIN